MSSAGKKDKGKVVPDGPGDSVKDPQPKLQLFGEEPPEEHKVKLVKGVYPFDEVASAMQKELRRGDLRQALWWGLLLYDAAPFYVWKRLLVCVVEDVGPASPETVDRVVNLALAWRICKDKSFFVSPHAVTFAIMMIAKAPKSTAVEDLQTIILTGIRDLAGKKSKAEWPPLPEYSRDAHTKAGKAAGKTWADWYFGKHQYLGLFGQPRDLASLATEWHVTTARASQITQQGLRLFLRQTGTIDDLPLAPRVKYVLGKPSAAFRPIVTLEQFRTTLPSIADTEFLKYAKIGRTTVAEMRRVWALYAGQAE